MKLTVIGAGGVRTPLVVESVLQHQALLGLTELALMDLDQERLDLMHLVAQHRLEAQAPGFEVAWTTDSEAALSGADYVITTFRQGGMASRVVDEQVPLRYGVLGQETTGPGGFAMALRTIPAVLDYVELIRRLAPKAWLINFTNPAGLVTEAITRVAGFERAVGICDNPTAMLRTAAEILGCAAGDLIPEYYGLNHLGWMSKLHLGGEDQVPRVLQALAASTTPVQGVPFGAGRLQSLGMIPNEYLYFYYSRRESVENLLQAGMSRAQQIQPFGDALLTELRRVRDGGGDPRAAAAAYDVYLRRRHGTYMTLEEGRSEPTPQPANGSDPEGYSGVALRLIGALSSRSGPKAMILNVPNRGAIPGMEFNDVVEVTSYVDDGVIRPLAVGPVPDHALALMRSVKAYERATIEAAVEGSYDKALEALAIHPLVPSYSLAQRILDDYIVEHGDAFPSLS